VHAVGSGWFKGHEVSYCSVGKGKCSGLFVIIFTYFCNEVQVLRATRFCFGSY
jgi:hypothetical protein